VTTHGSARWYDWPANWLLTFGQACAARTPLLTLGRPTQGDDTHAVYAPEKHLITFAPNRSGKGASLIIPSLLLWSGSVLVLDPKGENAWRTAEQRRRMGQKVHVLDPFNGVSRFSGGTPEQRGRLNPLVGLTLEDQEDVRNLADALVVRGIGGGNSAHFEDSAIDLLEGLILFEIEDAERRGEVPDIGRVRATAADPELGQKCAKVAQGIEQADVAPYAAAGKLARFKNLGDEIASIFSTASTQTTFLDNPKILASMQGNDFTLSDLVDGNTTVYVVLPSELLETYGRWMRLVLARAISDVVKVQPEIPVLFLLDEFGTVGRLNIVARALGLMAGQGIRVWSFLQDINQLQFHYKEWQTFLANSGVVQFFATNDYETAKYVSDYIGPATVQIKREQEFKLSDDYRLNFRAFIGSVLESLSKDKPPLTYAAVKSYHAPESRHNLESSRKVYNWLRDHPEAHLPTYDLARFSRLSWHFSKKFDLQDPSLDRRRLKEERIKNDEQLALTKDDLIFLEDRNNPFFRAFSPDNASIATFCSIMSSAAHGFTEFMRDRDTEILNKKVVADDTPNLVGRPLLFPNEVIMHPRERIITFLDGAPIDLWQAHYYRCHEFEGLWREREPRPPP
jgi:type IV secretory pathway TraG/TraD family ATPase VirD4